MNPAATGGAGTHFEHRVGAFFLGLLLTRGVPPFMPRCSIETVHLQSGHLGWATDDLLLVGQEQNRKTRHLVIQVKTGFVLSLKDDECISTFTRAWEDFTAKNRFDPSNDLIILITDPASAKLQHGLRGLLDCARSTLDAKGFLDRLSLEQYWGKPSQNYCTIIRAILDSAKGSPVTDDEIWRFLCVFDFGAFDLGSSGSILETLLISRLADSCSSIVEATSTWVELVSLSGLSAGKAGSFDFEKLPQHLRDRHTNTNNTARDALQRLRDHTEITVQSVRTELKAADTFVTLPRSLLETQLLSSIEAHQLVLVAGEAGAGKSAIAKKAFQFLEGTSLSLAFRADEFARPHLNEVFAPFGVNFADLRKATAGFARKVLWIESVERLLEKTTRQAFTDLLSEIRTDVTWRIIVTCRDYSVETVRTAFFDQGAVTGHLLAVPLLSYEELDAVSLRIPTLKIPLSNNRLKPLLRNLFVLDKAVQLNWQQGPVPANENEFRVRVWGELVRRNDQTTEALPMRREEIFMRVALLRARALEPFVNGYDLDSLAVQRLREDGLLITLPGDDWMLAPAHDVLEDWAIMLWLDRQFGRYRRNAQSFFAEVGTYPALRRAYRRWLTELLNSRPLEADVFAIAVIRDTALPDHWRDDTIVASLLSATASEFLDRNRSVWLENDLHLLRRIIHILRIAGKNNPSWLKNIPGLPGSFLTAQGVAWGSLSAIIWQEIGHFRPTDTSLLVAFFEDWSSSVTCWAPYPSGAQAVARACLYLLPKDNDRLLYMPRASLSERLTKILLKIPLSISAELSQTIRRLLPEVQWSQWETSLPALSLSFFNGYAMSRDLPDLVIECADQWLSLDGRSEPDEIWHRSNKIETAFGLSTQLHFSTYPASAWRGPFLHLLREHPDKGIEFILRFINNAVATYADPKRLRGFVEPPFEIMLRFPDGSKRQQWASGRLWCMFCGASNGPYIMQSALMALEAWLIEQGDARTHNLAARLLDLLKRSNNVSITAVVASVARAFPDQAGPAGVAVLSGQYFYHWDRHRCTQEMVDVNGQIAQMFPTIDAEKDLLNYERVQAEKRTHRRVDLEWLACTLQATSAKNEVLRLIDELHAESPPELEQDDETKLWRLLLHRIDSRNWIVVANTPGGEVIVESSPPAADIQELIDRTKPAIDRNLDQQDLLAWGMGLFYRPANHKLPNASVWREQLARAQFLQATADSTTNCEAKIFEISAITFVAAVCVKDQWSDLNSSERIWCTQLLCEAVERDADSLDISVIVGRNNMNGSLPAAYLVSNLCNHELPSELKVRVRKALGLALGHMAEEVRLWAAMGVRTFVWEKDRSLIAKCIQGLAAEAEMLANLHISEKAKDYNQRRDWTEISREARGLVREAISQNCHTEIPENIEISLSETSNTSIELILLILDGHADEILTTSLADQMARQLVAAWAIDSRHLNNVIRQGGYRTRNFELELKIKQRLSHLVMSLAPSEAITILAPVINAVPMMGKEVSEFLDLLVSRANSPRSIEVFWAIWQSIADEFLSYIKAAQFDRNNSDTQELLYWLFLHYGWKDADIDWKPLHQHESKVDSLAEKLPNDVMPLSAYIVYLHTVGKSSLPHAFLLLARKLESLPLGASLTADTLLRLEVILAKHVYSGSTAIRTDSKLRPATLKILDILIEQGSSAAFRMRDDFVTPIG